jgi:hypothetical protein
VALSIEMLPAVDGLHGYAVVALLLPLRANSIRRA